MTGFVRHRRALVLIATLGVVAAACSSTPAPSAPSSAASAPSAAAPSSAPSTPAQSVAAPSPAGSASTGNLLSTNLKGICPDNIVIQTGWYPEVDFGFLYQLIGPNGTIDTQKLTYSGPLGQTGVNVELRAGGPAIGFQQVSSLLYQDPSIYLGLVTTDEQIQDSKAQPTVSVFSSYDKNPQIWMWGNPSLNFTSTADIGKAGITVLAFDGATYLDVFTQKGLLTKSQVDTSYKGDPARFVTEGGNVVQQGFVTNEPYQYEHLVPAWNKPVKYILADYPVYENTVAVRADKLAADTPCLQKLVPILQQAQIDYIKDPSAVDAFLVTYATQSKGQFQVDAGLAADASQKQVSLGLIENGTDGVLGSFDTARVQSLIDELKPVFKADNKPINDAITPADIVTNQFLDPSLKVP